MSEDVTPYGATPEEGDRLAEIRALAAELGWSQREAGRQLGIDERLARAWFAGTKPAPIMVLWALRYALEHMKAGRAVADGGRK